MGHAPFVALAAAMTLAAPAHATSAGELAAACEREIQVGKAQDNGFCVGFINAVVQMSRRFRAELPPEYRSCTTNEEDGAVLGMVVAALRGLKTTNYGRSYDRTYDRADVFILDRLAANWPCR